ncbi:MAG: OmpA family protein [Anaeromyxobacteraceae bacterium]
MRSTHTHSLRAAALAGALLAACAAQPKKLNTGADVNDAPVAAAAPAPAPAPAAKDPGACSTDADCASGEGCAAGRCVARARCDLTRVSFAFDSSALDEPAMQSLRDDARCLQQRRAAALVIEGHCDERGTTSYNIALGAKRAETVKRYLSDLGVATRIETVSFGKELPAAQGTGEAVWSKNRRAELKAPGDTRSDGKMVSSDRS